MRSVIAAVCALILLTGGAQAAYPERSIHLVVGFPPGGGNDTLARQLAPRLGAALGNASVIVENRPGADGIIATNYVSHAAPDGYTLNLAGLSSLVLATFTYRDIAYHPLTDFAGIGTVASAPLLFAVKPSLPVTSFKDLIAYAKSHPGKLNFAVVGVGGSTRMMLELFQSATAVKVRYVAYKGAAQALTDILGGRIDAMAIDFPVLYPLSKQGRLRPLAMTGARRSPLLPAVPTMAELGFAQLQQGNWYALLAPPKTPAAITGRLSAALTQVVKSPQMQKVFEQSGLEAMPQKSPAAFGDFLKDQLARWGGVVRAAGIKPQ